MYAKINDSVRLISALPKESLLQNARGVVVHEFTEPEEAYEIEFIDENGATITTVALTPDQFVVVK